MSTITYAYQVLSSDFVRKVMTVEYTADGYPTMIVGMPLPTTDSTLTAMIELYAPIQTWRATEQVFIDVPVATTGVVTHDPAPPVVTPPAPTPVAPVFNPAIFEERVLAVLTKYGVPVVTPTAP